MEHQANAAAPETAPMVGAESATGQPDAQLQVERFMIPPKEFVRQVYLACGAVVVLLSLAIWLMMILT